MTIELDDTHAMEMQELERTDNDVSLFTKKIARLNAIACDLTKHDDIDMTKAEKESIDGLKALAAKGGVQEMLVAQMLSIHQLQQISMMVANKAENTNNKQYFTNTAIKLANTFVQQATLLNKLQVGGQQKITVEHVEVHNGGQALVGNVHGGVPFKRGKNENELM